MPSADADVLSLFKLPKGKVLIFLKFMVESSAQIAIMDFLHLRKMQPPGPIRIVKVCSTRGRRILPGGSTRRCRAGFI